MKILLTYGKDDFLEVSKKFEGEALQVAKEVKGLLDRGKYLHDVCNDQQVYRINETDLPKYTELSEKVKDWFSTYDTDKSKYTFARYVKFWQ